MNYIIRHVADAYWIVKTDYEAQYVPPLMTNETGCMMWENLSSGLSVEETAQNIAKEYEISYEQAKLDVETFVSLLELKGFAVN